MSNLPIASLSALPFYFSGRFPKPVIIRRCLSEGYDTYASRELFDYIRDVSLGLGGLGVQPGDRVAVLCESRPEWLIADLAILSAGAVTVPIYPSLPAELVGYILADASVTVAIVSDDHQYKKIEEVWDDQPSLRAVAIIDSHGEEKTSKNKCLFSKLRELGHQRLMHEDGLGRKYKENAMSISSDDLATIIYTSGTTGKPKGVMLNHGAIVANILDVDTMVHIHEEDEALSFLPLSHILERSSTYLYLFKGVTITFAESLDTVVRDLPRVRPTLMNGVPRVFEKIYSRVLEAASEFSTLRKFVFDKSLRVGGLQAKALRDGELPSFICRLFHPVADRMVLSKIRERTGGRLRFVVSGGAPLPVVVAEFLFSVGIPVLEGYGLTETAPVLTCNPQRAPKIGTVGIPLPHVELRLAEDGEIIARGPNVMTGYYRNQEATSEALRSGWFYTGDIGEFDADGYLRITDRKKELLVTSGGKNVAPSPIEQRLKHDKLIAEAMLVGDSYPFISVLIFPDFSALVAHIHAPEDIAWKDMINRPDVKTMFDDIVDKVNEGLPSHEKMRRVGLIPATLSISTGELTPTLKLKRRIVLSKWDAEIKSLYA